MKINDRVNIWVWNGYYDDIPSKILVLENSILLSLLLSSLCNK